MFTDKIEERRSGHLSLATVDVQSGSHAETMLAAVYRVVASLATPSVAESSKG